MAVLGNRVPSTAVLFSAAKRRTLPTGLIRGGNSAGDGILITSCKPLETLVVAIGAIFQIPWVHTVMTSLRGEQQIDTPLPDLARFDAWWRYSNVGTELSLEGGFEGFLSRLRPRSRRNYRYFRRRAEAEMDVSFVPELGRHDAIHAVTQLHDVGLYPLSHKQSLLTETAVRQMPGSFAMALKTPSGNWLSYLGGWRHSGTTYVEFQLNDHRHQAASISTVMRTYLIEHEAARGVDRIVFVGGSTDALGRYCKPAQCLNLLVMRKGVRGKIAQILVNAFSPNGQIATILQNAPMLPKVGVQSNHADT